MGNSVGILRQIWFQCYDSIDTLLKDWYYLMTALLGGSR